VYVVHLVRNGCLASWAFRRRLFSIRCCGVSAPVTPPPVLSNLGGCKPDRAVSVLSACGVSAMETSPPVHSTVLSNLGGCRNDRTVSVLSTCGVSAMETPPPVHSNVGGIWPDRSVPPPSFNAVNLVDTLAGDNLPSPSSRSGGWATRAVVAPGDSSSRPHHFSPAMYFNLFVFS
jgi:hypothetical protein